MVITNLVCTVILLTSNIRKLIRFTPPSLFPTGRPFAKRKSETQKPNVLKNHALKNIVLNSWSSSMWQLFAFSSESKCFPILHPCNFHHNFLSQSPLHHNQRFKPRSDLQDATKLELRAFHINFCQKKPNKLAHILPTCSIIHWIRQLHNYMRFQWWKKITSYTPRFIFSPDFLTASGNTWKRALVNDLTDSNVSFLTLSVCIAVDLSSKSPSSTFPTILFFHLQQISLQVHGPAKTLQFDFNFESPIYC